MLEVQNSTSISALDVSKRTTSHIQTEDNHFHAAGRTGAGDSSMPITSKVEEVPLETKALFPCPINSSKSPPLIEILLLEGDFGVPSKSAKLLMDPRYRVTTVCNQSDLFVLRTTIGISVAIINDRMGAAALDIAARAIRLAWPLARILVLGKAQIVLEDYLYDEAIEHRFVGSDLCVSLERLSHSSMNRGPDGGLFILRRGTTATDARPPRGS
ncbi:hypothetical protein [Granulicella sibirica]|uniref:hypothetical protein n=1 Tax=Granulicella sibirica TaxID=2479048 RepID=UPI001008E14D|nr:hypothetical protein [Granulicella sibirica]